MGSLADLERLLALARQYEADGRADEFPTEYVNQILDLRDRQRLETSLYEFVQAAWPVIEPGKEFTPGWHIQAICEHMEAVSRGALSRLVICVPPRSSKSSVVSVLFPAWEWATRPALQYLCLSHSDRMATRDTRRMRMVVQSDWYQKHWPVTFARDENQKFSFLNDAQGYRIAAGITSQYTGQGGDRILIDDALDRDAAHSDLQRQACIDAYREKASTRLNNAETGAIVAIGQRLHQSDLLGFLMDLGFERLVLPMWYESDHPHRTTTWFSDPRKEGEPLCPKRFSDEYLKEQQTVLGAYGIAGQFQQRPAPRDGGMFKQEWVQLVDATPKDVVATVRYFDCAASTSDTADYTAGVRMSLDRNGIVWVEHVMRGRWTPGERDRVICNTVQMDGRSTHVYMEQEPGASGVSLIAHYTRLLAGYVFKPDRVDKRKELRAEPVAAYMEAGNVRILNGPFAREFLDELLIFPNGDHDDQCDCFSGAFGKLMEIGDQSWRRSQPLLASGEDPDEERRPFDDSELAELPDFLRELVTESRASGEERREMRRWDDDRFQ